MSHTFTKFVDGSAVAKLIANKKKKAKVYMTPVVFDVQYECV